MSTLPKIKINPAVKRSILAAQKARWAKITAANPVAPTQSVVAVTQSPPAAALITTGTWDGVRHWQTAAKLFEQGKLFSQVMIGFELLALHKANGISQGKRTDLSGNFPQSGGSWEDILQKETGLADSTARRYMDMATAAAPRLKKLPALKNFDPFTNNIAQLPEPQRKALTSAVKKLTDGKSQADFFEELYKQGGKGTGREPGCDNTKTKPSLADQVAAQQALAAEQWKAIEKQLTAYADKFTVLTDHFGAEAQSAVLERALNARKAWLKQPANKRDPKAIAEMFQGGAQ